jgi:hypothetical protein
MPVVLGKDDQHALDTHRPARLAHALLLIDQLGNGPLVARNDHFLAQGKFVDQL